MDVTLIIDAILPWLAAHGFKIAGIFIGAFIVVKFSHVFIEKAIRKAIVGDKFLTKEAERKREDTLIQVASGTLKIVIWITALLMIVSEFGVEIGPIIAAAGIVGIAVGFGGQYLIRDVISGLFIILENQYRVGDVICIGDVCGCVETITLRITVLRGKDGEVHHIPNGEIKIATNKSKDFARVNLNIGVSYSADLDKVKKVVDEVGKKLAADPDWKEQINEAPRFVRVNKLDDSAVVIRITCEVKPLKQWGVAGELRKRIKIAFDKAGIEIPFPQRVIHQVK